MLRRQVRFTGGIKLGMGILVMAHLGSGTSGS